MAQDIRSGPVHRNPQAPRAKSGGIKSARQVHAYQRPQGPTSISNRGPGLGGSVHHCGSQGEYSLNERQSGNVGLGGDKHPKGSQR